eukprot:3158462-Amphidinium_carterae.1
MPLVSPLLSLFDLIAGRDSNGAAGAFTLMLRRWLGSRPMEQYYNNLSSLASPPSLLLLMCLAMRSLVP